MFIKINEILSSIRSRAGIKNKLEEQTLKQALKQKFDIDNVSLRYGRVELKVKSSILAQELSFEKENIRKEISKVLGEEATKEIIIRT